jgi:hypothetical protein
LIPLPNQQLNQTIPKRFIHAVIQPLITLSTGVSFQILGRQIEVVSLHDSAVGSGQATERKTKNLGNIRLDIETDLREFEKENPSRRINEGLEITSSEQQQGTSARNGRWNKIRNIYEKQTEVDSGYDYLNDEISNRLMKIQNPIIIFDSEHKNEKENAVKISDENLSQKRSNVNCKMHSEKTNHELKSELKYWCRWKENNKSTLILQVFGTIEFKKIFKDPRLSMFKDDKFWLSSKYIEENKKFEKGYYSLYHTTSLKGGGKQKRTLFDLPIKIREDVQDDCSNELTIQLFDRYEEIHGMEKDTCTMEILEEMKDDEIDSIMKEIRRTEYKNWEIEKIIQSANFYNNVINETVQIVRTIRKKLETEAMRKREYTEDHDDPAIPDTFNPFQFVECDNYMTEKVR